MNVWTLAGAVFLMNLPLGWWRSRVPKFSWRWVLAIHLPIPVIIALRVYSGLGFRLYTFPITISAYFLGQFLGGRIGRVLSQRMADVRSDSE